MAGHAEGLGPCSGHSDARDTEREREGEGEGESESERERERERERESEGEGEGESESESESTSRAIVSDGTAAICPGRGAAVALRFDSG